MVKLKEEDKRQAKAKQDSKKETEEKGKKEEKGKEETVQTNATLEDLDIVFYPLVTEKAVNMIESQNKVTFVVSDKAGKKDVKDVVESAYGVKVDKVNVIRGRKGKKKALVKLKPGFKAEELATKLGVL